MNGMKIDAGKLIQESLPACPTRHLLQTYISLWGVTWEENEEMLKTMVLIELCDGVPALRRREARNRRVEEASMPRPPRTSENPMPPSIVDDKLEAL